MLIGPRPFTRVVSYIVPPRAVEWRWVFFLLEVVN